MMKFSSDVGSVTSSPSCFSSSCSASSSLSSLNSSPDTFLPTKITSSLVASSSSLSSSPQTLSETKSFFVEALVDAATYLVEAIWPFSTSSSCFIDQSTPLKRFVQETLRRSRTSYPTLQLALYYLILIKPHVYKTREENKRSGNTTAPRSESLAMRCGRRTFLTALMLASKYSQDRNYSVAAWSKISGLTVAELSANEVKFLGAVEWNLFVSCEVYERWSEVLVECACGKTVLVTEKEEERLEMEKGQVMDHLRHGTPCAHVHDEAQDKKRLAWIDRFTAMNSGITNCEWIKASVNFNSICEENGITFDRGLTPGFIRGVGSSFSFKSGFAVSGPASPDLSTRKVNGNKQKHGYPPSLQRVSKPNNVNVLPPSTTHHRIEKPFKNNVNNIKSNNVNSINNIKDNSIKNNSFKSVGATSSFDYFGPFGLNKHQQPTRFYQQLLIYTRLSTKPIEPEQAFFKSSCLVESF